jgi:hypothetical protein
MIEFHGPPALFPLRFCGLSSVIVLEGSNGGKFYVIVMVFVFRYMEIRGRGVALAVAGCAAAAAACEQICRLTPPTLSSASSLKPQGEWD